jgi:hypothetical protein
MDKKRNRPRPLDKKSSWLFLVLFHRGGVFATARGAMEQSLLRRFHFGFFALPDFQGWLLDGAGK